MFMCVWQIRVLLESSGYNTNNSNIFRNDRSCGSDNFAIFSVHAAYPNGNPSAYPQS